MSQDPEGLAKNFFGGNLYWGRSTFTDAIRAIQIKKKNPKYDTNLCFSFWGYPSIRKSIMIYFEDHRYITQTLPVCMHIHVLSFLNELN